jgi:hypothetical protein
LKYYLCAAAAAVLKALTDFISAARKQDAGLSIFIFHVEGNINCSAIYTPDNSEGIERYYKYEVKAKNVNGKLRIMTSIVIGAMKKKNPRFSNYLDGNRVYINNAQLGDEDGPPLGWISKAHPAFGF